MQDFFSDVEAVKRNILVIRNSTKRVSEINQQVNLRLLCVRLILVHLLMHITYSNHDR
jgi:hypothetical protein